MFTSCSILHMLSIMHGSSLRLTGSSAHDSAGSCAAARHLWQSMSSGCICRPRHVLGSEKHDLTCDRCTVWCLPPVGRCCCALWTCLLAFLRCAWAHVPSFQVQAPSLIIRLMSDACACSIHSPVLCSAGRCACRMRDVLVMYRLAAQCIQAKHLEVSPSDLHGGCVRRSSSLRWRPACRCG